MSMPLSWRGYAGVPTPVNVLLHHCLLPAHLNSYPLSFTSDAGVEVQARAQEVEAEGSGSSAGLPRVVALAPPCPGDVVEVHARAASVFFSPPPPPSLRQQRVTFGMGPTAPAARALPASNRRQFLRRTSPFPPFLLPPPSSLLWWRRNWGKSSKAAANWELQLGMGSYTRGLGFEVQADGGDCWGKWPSKALSTTGRADDFGSHAASAIWGKFCIGGLTETLMLLELCEFCCAGAAHLSSVGLRCRKHGQLRFGAEGLEEPEAPRVECTSARGWRRPGRDVLKGATRQERDHG
jgi:hypothetical protein